MHVIIVAAYTNRVALQSFANAAEIRPQFFPYFGVNKRIAVLCAECDMYIYF
jgi:hypothetical protein